MEDVNISKYRASVVREGSKPASPGFVVSEGQSPTDPAGTGQNHLPVTIATEATGLSITESQILSGAGTVAQYIRGDGSLADFPESSGGGSSVSYYLNGSVNQGTIGGVAYKELNKVPILGAGTDFTINANGYIASFLTDAGDPNLLEIPGGNWNFETYFSANNGGGSPTFYVELYKYNGTTFTLIASNSTVPELIAFGTNITAYFTTLAVPTTTLALTDRLAVRYYVTHSGRTITMHTEGPHLCQIITTFTTGLTALNGLTAQVQNFATGTTGTDFNIASATATHTFNLPTASATNRGALSSSDWSTFNAKQNALTLTTTGSSGAATLVGSTLNIPIYSPDLSGYVPTSRTITINGTTQDLSANRTFNVGTVTSVGLSSATSGVTIGSTPVTTSGTITLAIATASGSQNGLLSSTDWTTFNGKQNALTNPVTGTGTTNYLPKFTGSTTVGNSQVFDNGTNVGIGTASPGAKLEVKQTGSEVPFIIDSSSDANAAYTLYQVNGSGGWETGMARAADGYSYIFSYGSFGTANAKFTIANSGAATFSSSVTANGIIVANSDIHQVSTGGLYWGAASTYVIGITGNTSSGNLSLITGSTVKATITSSGNVGIGTVSPFARLHVRNSDVNEGTIAIGNDNYPGLIYSSASTGEFRIDNRSSAGAGYITFFPNGQQNTLGNEAMRIATSRNVLIGTTTDASAKLYVNGNILIPADGRLYGNSATVTGSRSYLELYNGSTGDINLVTGFSSASIVFGTQQGTERMRITSGGNVGIGTASPTEKLDVLGVFRNLVPSAPPVGGMITSKVLSYSLNPYGLIFRSYPSGVQSIQSQREGNDGELFGLSLQPLGGNVLIGTTTDAGQRLQVSGSIYLLTGGNRNIRIGSATNYYYDLQSTNDDFQIIEAGSTPRLTIKYPNGNVGIGTTSPGYKTVIQTANQTTGLLVTTNANDSETGLYIQPDHTNGIVKLFASGGTNKAFAFLNGNTEAMRINSSGQVLIGNTGQDGKVAIRTNSTVAYNPNGYNGVNSNIRLENGSAGSGRFSGIAFTGGGSTEGFFGVVQNASTLAEFVWQTYNGATYGERMRMTSSGNVLIGTTTDNGNRLRVNGVGYFDEGVRTGQPVGTTTNNWLLGRALVSGTSTPDRWIRVQIGLEYYDILAVYMGTL